MNGDIVIRAWDKANNKWLVGTDFCDQLNFYNRAHSAKLLGYPRDRIDEISITLSIGIADKKGATIFVGDIVKWSGSRGSRVLTGTVVLKNGSFRLINPSGEWDLPNQVFVEVIGNIFEHPDMEGAVHEL